MIGKRRPNAAQKGVRQASGTKPVVGLRVGSAQNPRVPGSEATAKAAGAHYRRPFGTGRGGSPSARA
eukprot:scaffold114355_cov61-Phaeocystis_antarctica.AAC.3